MRAIVVTETGGPEVLQWQDHPDPILKADEVLIRVAAAGVNFGETMQRAGTYPLPLSLPAVPGSEIAGVVVAIGSNVSGVAPGDRVAAMLLTPEGMWAAGGYAEFAAAPADRVFKLADSVSFEQSLAVFGQGLTAWFMLTEAAPITAGQSVLVHAAAGGVGSLAVQIALLRGAGKVLGTAGDPGKRALVERLGAEPIDYRTDTWPAAVKAATNGGGVDVVLDPLGGAATARSLGTLAPLGRLVFFGSLSGAMPEFGPDAWGQIVFMNLSVRGFANMTYTSDVSATRTAAEALLAHLAAGELHVELSRFPMADAAAAHRAIEARATTGKVVLTL